MSLVFPSIAAFLASHGLPGLPELTERRFPATKQNRRNRRKRARVATARRARKHNPAGTKLARKAREGKLTINTRGW